MKTIIWTSASAEQQAEALQRPATGADPALAEKVGKILADVKSRGDEALSELAQRFDGVALKDFRVSKDDMATAIGKITPRLSAAIQQAKANITAFHEAARPQTVKIETMPGVVCELHWRPIEKIGFYIPGGTAPLFSTVLMQGIPAQIAGNRQAILCTPPRKDGSVHPAILTAAQLCGITQIYALGGAQAIAAMAYGTASIPKVDKIFGPGNAYVTMAKQLVAQDAAGAAIDMPAGPSEVMVIADGQAEPKWVAADLLAQAEHDASAQAILVTTDDAMASQVQSAVLEQLAALPRRAIAEASLKEGRIIIVSSMAQAIHIANLYAPEHLILHAENAGEALPAIQHAGSVFLGPWTPESAGDYASGTNHVLPTYGYARAFGGLTVMSFLKSMSVQTITRDGLRALGPALIEMAEAEGLGAHAASVRIRVESNR
ncbi:MAG: histidinol dehydrogenase [Pseudomonadota bacterium]|nr:histidinol dehydrogenase [Pseudomonadota bacterium]